MAAAHRHQLRTVRALRPLSADTRSRSSSAYRTLRRRRGNRPSSARGHSATAPRHRRMPCLRTHASPPSELRCSSPPVCRAQPVLALRSTAPLTALPSAAAQPPARAPRLRSRATPSAAPTPPAAALPASPARSPYSPGRRPTRPYARLGLAAAPYAALPEVGGPLHTSHPSPHHLPTRCHLGRIRVREWLDPRPLPARLHISSTIPHPCSLPEHRSTSAGHGTGAPPPSPVSSTSPYTSRPSSRPHHPRSRASPPPSSPEPFVALLLLPHTSSTHDQRIHHPIHRSSVALHLHPLRPSLTPPHSTFAKRPATSPRAPPCIALATGSRLSIRASSTTDDVIAPSAGLPRHHHLLATRLPTPTPHSAVELHPMAYVSRRPSPTVTMPPSSTTSTPPSSFVIPVGASRLIAE